MTSQRSAEADSISDASASFHVTPSTTLAGSTSLPKSTPEQPTALAPFSSITNHDPGSILDNTHFLSFEEWKQKNLEKAGQSAEHIDKARLIGNAARSRPDLTNALEGLGDDAEIELDFSGFITPVSPAKPLTSLVNNHQAASSSQDMPRNKDAGKTCKERTNYASFDCAATMLRTNPECKSASSILVESKDSYMLNVCQVKNKFFIVELCDDILIDTVVLASYEFFSSIFHTFRLSISDRYPVKADKWRELGTYEARNTRQLQAFLIEQPLIWARYLRVEILSHYGNEYYCPISLLRVHGTTMLAEFRHQEEIARGEDTEEVAIISESTRLPNADDVVHHSPDKSASSTSNIASKVDSMIQETATAAPSQDAAVSQSSTISSQARTDMQDSGKAGNQVSPREISHAASPSQNTTAVPLSTMNVDTTSSIATNVSNATVTESRMSAIQASDAITTNTSTISNPSLLSANATEASDSNTTISSKHVLSATTSPISDGVSDLSKRVFSAVITPTSSSSTQESFFKSVHKRLQMLESNATLSLQYIEEQSLILREAFSQVERRQLYKAEMFLKSLNESVNGELQSFRNQYDQLWQSTVIELESHQRQYQQEFLAVSARLNAVAEELLYQKRMAMVQTTLLIFCLFLVTFSKVAGIEVPALQQMIRKSIFANVSTYNNGISPPISPVNAKRQLYRSSFWRNSISSAWPHQSSADENADIAPVKASEIGETLIRPDLRFTDASSSSGGSNGGHDSTAHHMFMGYEDEKDADDGQDDHFDDANDDMLNIPAETQSGPATPTGLGKTFGSSIFHTDVPA